MAEGKLSVREKLGYGLGDTGSNIVFQVVINFILYYYTDVFGITAAAAGTLMLVVRLFDAVTDPLMGGLADRTNTRWGRYRPYLLWIAIPYGLLAISAFYTPDTNEANKLIYAYITYTLLMTAYTAINIPYSALGGVITGDTQERASVQTWRFGMAKIGGLLIAAATLPLVAYFGDGDEQLGWTLAMAVMAFIAVLCFVGCFAFTKERVEQPRQQTSIASDVILMMKNDQWRILAGVTFFLLIAVAMRGAVTPYYAKYFHSDEAMVSVFVTVSMIAGIAGAVAANFLCKIFCKVTLMKFAAVGIVASNTLLFFVPREAVYAALAITFVAQFVHLIFIPMLFSAVPDTVDYSIAENGRGAMAMSFSGHLLALKLGVAVGGALAGWVLAGYGYQANVEQTDKALSGILYIFAGSPVVAGLIVLGLLQFYLLDGNWRENTEKLAGEAAGGEPTGGSE